MGNGFLFRKTSSTTATAPPADGPLLDAILDATPEWISLVAADGRLVRLNEAGLRMIEADAWETVEGASMPDFIAPEHRESWHAHHARVCLGETLTWTFDLVGLNGTRRVVEAHAVPLAVADGTVAELAVIRDITQPASRSAELEAARSQLRKNELSFAMLVSGVTDYAIFMLDLDGHIASWNAGAERIKGYTAPDIIGEHFSRFYTEEDRKAGLPARALAHAAREGRWEAEGWRVRKDGTRFWANVIIDAIHDGDELIGFAKITRDLTEKRAAEAQLRQAQKMEALGQFTGGVAHDFNNLLMAISGSLEILRKRLPDDRRLVPLLDNAMRGVRRGSSLTQRMLAYARRQDLKQEAVDVGNLVEGIRELLTRTLGPAIDIETRFPRAMACVRTDANQLETALLNLALNARDAMPRGGKIVVAAREEEVAAGHLTRLPPGPYVCLSVTDNGTGMDEETLARVTEPFFTTKGVGKGTGLGLSMVDGVMDQCGGKLAVRSMLGVGTTVELWLPTAETNVAGKIVVPEQSEPATGSQRLILAVDDDSLILSNMVAMLEDLGHTVIEASSGAKALDVISSNPGIDLVVSDQAMPGMSGIQLVEAIRARWPKLPVIICTGYAELPPGANPNVRRLSKPFTQHDLAQAVAATLRAA
jgi:PAS domain S-box-containing protein